MADQQLMITDPTEIKAVLSTPAAQAIIREAVAPYLAEYQASAYTFSLVRKQFETDFPKAFDPMIDDASSGLSVPEFAKFEKLQHAFQDWQEKAGKAQLQVFNAINGAVNEKLYIDTTPPVDTHGVEPERDATGFSEVMKMVNRLADLPQATQPLITLPQGIQNRAGAAYGR